MTLHAKLSASGAHRWMACPGSVNAESNYPNKSSSFAEEGTRAHELMEACLVSGLDAAEISVDEEMADSVQIYLDYVRSILPDHLFVEKEVDFSEWIPGGFGTADTIAIKNNTLHIVDLKYGKGVRVDAERNPQAMLYALGAYAEYGFLKEFTTVKIAIIQPRLDHISEWELSIVDLLKWGEQASQAAAETESPQAKRIPGEKQCRFCKAKASCAALAAMTENTIMADFEALGEIQPPNKLTQERMAIVLRAKPLIEAWLSAVENEVKTVLAEGKEFPGFKLVEGRSNRKWIDDEITVSTQLGSKLGEDLWTTKMITPTQAEKLLGKKGKAYLDGLVTKPRGIPTLAREDDPRPAIGSVEMDFNEMLDED